MSVQLFLSNTFEMASTAVFRELKKVSHEKCIILVPDKFTLSFEKSILKTLGIVGSFDIEVSTFSRLAQKTMQKRINKCLSPEGTVMLLRRAIDEVKGELKVYNNTDSVDFPREMYAVITSLRNSGVSYDDLLDKFRPSDKLYDVGLIYRSYITLLKKSFNDGSTRLEALSKYISEGELFSDTNFFVVDFPLFTATQFEVLTKLFVNSKSVTVGLVTKGSEARNARLINTRAYHSIVDFVRSSNIKYSETYVEDTSLLPYKKQLLYGLFSYSKLPSVGVKDSVEIYSMKNCLEEISFVARTIKQRVLDGARYNDFAVVLSDVETYRGLVDGIFKRFEIPYFLDKKVVFSSMPSAKFILSALKVIADNYSINSILELVKNRLFLKFVSRDEVELFEYFVRENSIKSLDKLDAKNPECTRVKNRVIEILKPFENAVDTESFIVAIKEFIEINHIEEILSEQEIVAESVEEKAESQFIDKLQSVLSEMQETLSGVKFSHLDFLNMLRSVFENIKIALVPMYLDSVYVGGVDESRYDDVKNMFIVGAVEGYFPKAVRDTAVLGRDEENELINNALELYPTKRDTMLLNAFNITELLIKHKEKLCITYPEIMAGAKVKKSAVISEMEEYLTVGGEKLRTKKVGDCDFSDSVTSARYFLTRKNGMYEMIKSAGGKVTPSSKKAFDGVYDLLSDDDKERVNRMLTIDDGEKPKVPGNISLARGTFSASQMENYFQCPYMQYFRYGLRLEPWTGGAMRTLETGTLSHAIMEKFVKTKAYLNPTDEVLKNTVEEAVEEVMRNDDFSKFNNARHRSTIQRIKREGILICKAIADQIANSTLKPYISEGKIGENNFSGIKVSVDGRDYQLVGSIDRIDEHDGVFTIIDYKSFKKDLTIKDVYSGTKIQPVLYMRAVGSDKNLKCPAGLLYQPISVGYKSEDDERFKMKGFIINDENILRLFDNSLEAGGKSKYYPVSLKKDGTPSKGNKIISDKVFTEMTIYAEKLVENAINEIISGNINPSPAVGACGLCDEKGICPYENDERLLRKKFPSLSADQLILLANGGEINSDEVENDPVD